LIRRVVVGMNPMPPKVIGRKTCLQIKSPYGLSKDHRLKRCPNIWRDESKNIKDFMKVEEGGVHHKNYDGYCMRQ
jgi:hypothetical protein